MKNLLKFKERFEDKLRHYLENTEDLKVKVPNDIFAYPPHYKNDLESTKTLHCVGDKNNLIKAIEYTLISKAKRLRPLIVYSAGMALEAPLEVLDKIAICAEMTHVISLIYDDLPSFDNDDMRHGKQSCHIAFTESTAILAAYSMTYLTFEILSTLDLPASKIIKIIQTLSSLTGSKGLALGEFFDLESFSETINISELQFTYYLKTAKLFAACALMASYAGKDISENDLQIIEKSILKMGIAFQIQDDLRNYSETAESLGKSPNSDILNQKPTIPGLLGVEAAYLMRDQLLGDFLTLLSGLSFDFSSLREIITYFDNFKPTLESYTPVIRPS